MLPFMLAFYDFSDRLRQYDPAYAESYGGHVFFRKKGSTMANIFESLNTLEQRALGVVAWLTAHGNQVQVIASQMEKMKADVADMFQQISAIKQEINSAPQSTNSKGTQ